MSPDAEYTTDVGSKKTGTTPATFTIVDAIRIEKIAIR